MSGMLDTLKEWVNPNWGHHRTVPPMDAGLRLNTRLDDAKDLLGDRETHPDDVLRDAAGDLVFTVGSVVYSLAGGQVRRIVDAGSPITAIAADGTRIVAAVSGRGIVSIAPSGGDAGGVVDDLCTDEILRDCVTALAAAGDGKLYAAVGSRKYGADEWARALLTDDSTGALVEVAGGHASVLDDGLAWPSGVAVMPSGAVLLSLSLAHQVELREPHALASTGSMLAENLPLYPGRICVDGDDIWVVAPYVRNRMTELLLDEHEFVADMMATVRPDDWFVPRLAVKNPLTDTMQMGQLRVEGEVKSWAPARSCGIVFRIDPDGRVVDSLHSRVDSPRHGMTGVTARDGVVVLAAQGYGNLVEIDANTDKTE
ncbi:hypothetical protein HUN08_17625 [Gordonia sp. X0973]|uniref:hypothetical protein n=1 Tax=Gordonia sp. X0973 TaxID=2742602 RepID=UPI000F524E06|nr:hypothetical protein [Gordonia sp. X0973]QKT08822.1 hypothetical protein HUN08_17625 [Gordonia sp. X0973]